MGGIPRQVPPAPIGARSGGVRLIANRNVLWAGATAQELARAGVRDVAIAPGSRSTPLVLAFNDEPGLRITTHIDERSAAFFALGVAKAGHRPAAVLTTSGTAAANVYPAVIEAHESQTPFVVITADRPPELHDVGANQSINQQHLFGSYPRLFADAGLPEPSAHRVRHLRTLVSRAVAYAAGPPAGPVHLNFPFREPLEPTPVAGDVPASWHGGDQEAERGRSDGRPFLDAPPPRLVPDAATVEALADLVHGTERGLLVCGPRNAADDFPTLVAELGRRTGFPILADPLSGVRFGAPSDAPILSGYDAFLAHGPTRARLAPDLVLRFGAAPTSKSTLTFLSQHPGAAHILVDEAGRLAEESARAQQAIRCDATALIPKILERLPAEPKTTPWTQTWTATETATWNVLEPELAHRAFEGATTAHLLAELPAGSILFVSNSLPIRDVDRFARSTAKPLRLLANRGASGIDGVTSTAAGAAHALGRRVTLLIGDLAFLHDLNGALAARRLGLPLDIMLQDNAGGGIFEFLPISRLEPPFTELFVTPPGLDLDRVADALGFGPRTLSGEQAITGRLTEPSAHGVQLTRIQSDRKANVDHRRALESALARALETLEEGPLHAP